MSSTIQISLNTEREIQLDKIRSKRKAFHGLPNSEVAKALLLEKIEEEIGDKK